VDTISEDFFPHKQMSEHSKMRNTDNTKNLHGKSEAGKITKEREFTISRKNYSHSRCVVITSAQVLHFFFPLLEKKGYLYFW